LQFFFFGANLVLCAFFFVFFYLYIRRRTGIENILAVSREEVNRLIAEIDRATDRDARLVEERIASLRKVLEEADRRIAVLSRDLDRRRVSTGLYTAQGKFSPAPETPGPVPGALPGTAPSGAGFPGFETPAAAASSAPPGFAAPSAPVSPAFEPPGPVSGTAVPGAAARGPAPSGVPPSAAGASSARSLTERVAELSRQGFAAELIAARLGLSLSEVELAIAVSRRRGA
jgi:hypothetical protein